MKRALCLLVIMLAGGVAASGAKQPLSQKIAVIFDTDANNELDDQHALAYLLLNDHTFNVMAVTVNATANGGDIQQHYKEALRVIQLCNKENEFPLLKGANANFETIQKELFNREYDGKDAVECIINMALQYTSKQKLVLLAVGKLTNIALALKRAPSIIPNSRVVWLGSNYPEPGEYNLENDIDAMNFVLDSGVEFEMAVCRYGKNSGTSYVKVSQALMTEKMAGAGPHTPHGVVGRHGGEFNCFGDYSVNLFKHCTFYGNPPSRSLFDMAAVAVVKKPQWATKKWIPCPVMVNEKWVDRPDNKHTIVVWEYFDAQAILTDFFNTIKQ